MDLTFFRNAQTKFASRSAARLDYGVLVATLEAMQSSSAAARAARRLCAESGRTFHRNGLVELVLGGPAWREAVVAQRGSFSPDWAERFGGRD